MLKLKIGNNFLITSASVLNLSHDNTIISYMASCFKGKDKVAVYLGRKNDYSGLIKEIKDSKTKTIYLLSYVPPQQARKGLHVVRSKDYYLSNCIDSIKRLILYLKENIPYVDIKVIKVNNKMRTAEFVVGHRFMNVLSGYSKSILKYDLVTLETYKECKSILKDADLELKVIEEARKKLLNQSETQNTEISLDAIKNLGLIDKADMLEDGTLELIINELPIYPSTPLGYYGSDDKLSNPYYAKVLKYIYSGCHFQMPKTKIHIRDFRPEFIETLDHRFDEMFSKNNWSTIGYPHFGKEHLCAGEFNDTISNGAKYGLSYYFLALKQYLTTANTDDIAGVKIWAYPIYDDNGNFVYSAAYDMLKDDVAHHSLYIPGISSEDAAAMSLEDFITAVEGKVPKTYMNTYSPRNWSYGAKQSKEWYVNWCKDNDKELYDKIMERRK